MIAGGVHPSAIIAFDADPNMTEIYRRLYPGAASFRARFREVDFRCENVIANPPFETAECTAFLAWLSVVQEPGDRAVLLLPSGFIDKQRSKTVQEVLRHFTVCDRILIKEAFARTSVQAEIVILERI